MSFLDEVKKLVAEGAVFEHTVVSWCAKEYQVFRKEEPTIIALADRAFPYVKSAVQIALTLEGQAGLSAAAGPLLDSIHAKADTAAALLYDFGPNPTVSSAITTLQGDISQFASVAGIKSPGATDALNKAVNGVAALSTAIKGAIAAATPVTA
jgi:hypothetical protein